MRAVPPCAISPMLLNKPARKWKVKNIQPLLNKDRGKKKHHVVTRHSLEFLHQLKVRAGY